MAENIDRDMMYFPHAPGAPPPVIHPPIVLPPAPPPVVEPPVIHPPVDQQPVVQQPVDQQPVVQQPVDNNIAGAPPPPPQQQEPLFIGPHILVGPRLPPIDDIVANDPEIRRICSELATLSNSLIFNNKEKIMNIASGQGRSYHQAPFNQQQYWQPPLSLEGWGIITLNTLLQQIKWYVRMATNPEPNRRRSFNFQQATDALRTTIRDNLNTKYNSAEQSDNISRANAMGFMPNPNANKERFWGTPGNVVFGAGSIGGIFSDILGSTTYAGGPPINDVRRYSELILQLYIRIQAILVENGIQQGGKKKRRRTQKVNNKQSSKRSSKQRKVNSKQSKKRK